MCDEFCVGRLYIESVVKYQKRFDKSTSLIFDSMKKKALEDEGREENDEAEVAWN